MTIKGKTNSGFEFEIDALALDDMELIDAVAETMDGNPLAFSKVCNKLFDADQKKRLYEHLRKNGRVPFEAISAEITDIFTALGDTGKNA